VKVPSQNEQLHMDRFKKDAKIGALALFQKYVVDSDSLSAFYLSRALLSARPEERSTVLDLAAAAYPDEDHLVLVDYLRYALNKADASLDAALAHASPLSAEDVLSFSEYYLLRMRNEGIGPDDSRHHRDIRDSQYEHLLFTLGEIFALIRKGKFPFKSVVRSRNKTGFQHFFIHFARHVSIRWQIVEVLRGAYVPRTGAWLRALYGMDQDWCKATEGVTFYLQKPVPDWAFREVYRDLNYHHSYRADANPEDLDSELQSIVRQQMDTSPLRIDVGSLQEKLGILQVDLKFRKVAEMLEPIYGDPATEFVYRGATYTIRQLIDISRAICLHADTRLDSAKGSSSKSISGLAKGVGTRALLRALGLQPEQEALLGLFAFDLSGETRAHRHYSPLLRRDNVYYVLTAQVFRQSWEKVIDKILSRRDVTVRIRDEKAKGFVFEKVLKDLIVENGYAWGDVKNKNAKGIPEIDGAFLLGADELVVYEAKCSIKPEERDDAYGFVDGLLSKAVAQLEQRVGFLRTRPEEAEQRLRFPIKGKRITPLVITNHSYFSGMAPIRAGDTVIHVIDIRLFEQIVIDRVVPVWHYDPVGEVYFRAEHSLASDQAVIDALTNPTRFLRGKVEPTIGISEIGIAYEVSKTPNIA